MTKDIQPKKFTTETSTVLDATLLALAEGITGILASKKEENILAIGHIFQRIRGGKFLHQLNEEWKRVRDKGKIKDDYQYTEQHQECLQEILDYLDNSLPNQITFEILKKLFLLASTETISDRESLLPQTYIRIIKKLSPEAILILNSTYNIAKTLSASGKTKKEIEDLFGTSAIYWLKEIAFKTCLIYPEIVSLFENELIKLNLISDRIQPDRSGIISSEMFRLTKLGFEICQYIEKYDEIVPPSE